MTIELYGLKNCDGCRKALKILQTRGDDVTFHDIREPQNTQRVVAWIKQAADVMAFVNKRSTTWRALDDEAKTDLTSARALTLLGANPTLIKRPVLRIGAQTLAGFDETQIDAALGR